MASDGVSDARVVNFRRRSGTGRIYFSTFPDNNKVREIEADPHVAFTTVPATVERFGGQLILFEIEFHEANMTIGLAHSGTLKPWIPFGEIAERARRYDSASLARLLKPIR